MTKDEYATRVSSAASTLLYELGVEEWKKENPGENFFAFWDKVDGYDKQHEVVDGILAGFDWKDAVEILQVSEQNPDDVDSGLYEGCGWKQILACIAFEVFSWDIYAEAQRMYDENEEPTKLARYPTNDRQIGFYPKTKTYRLRTTQKQFTHACIMSDFIKVIFQEGNYFKKPPRTMDAVVFEGKITKKHQGAVVECRRIYLQGFEGRKIEELVPECEQYGMREEKKKR